MFKFNILVLLSIFYFKNVSAEMECGASSALKQHIITEPINMPLGGVCTYTLTPVNVNVCQLRIDFLNFTLAQPTIYTHPMCIDDEFIVGNIKLCGENAGQHVYVEFNATSTINPRPSVPISFHIKDRVTHPLLPIPSWQIRVTQLECPPGSPRSENKNDVEISPAVDVQQPRLDEYWLAPPGCLQYFPDPEGQFESFNLNGGIGPYIGDMKYSICFRRFWESRKLQLNATIFQLGSFANDTNFGYDAACYNELYVSNRSDDYLLLPFATVNMNGYLARGTRYCDRSLLNQVAELEIPGPFMIMFNSDNLYRPYLSSDEIGFRFTYAVI